jgi:hypothetical protein
MAFETFDLGRVIQTAEAIKGMKREEENDRIRNQYMGVQMKNAEQAGQIAGAQEARTATQFSQEQQIQGTRMLNVAAKSVAADPSTAAQWLPQLKQAGIDIDIASIPPEQLKTLAAKIAAQTDTVLNAYIRQNPQFAQMDQEHQNRLAQINAQAGLAAKQDATNFTQQKEILGLQHGNRLTEIDAQGANALAVAAARANKDKTVDAKTIQQTWNTYTEAKKGLLAGLEGTETGPMVGRVPAVTTGQQVAEGAISAMAPVLKQIFRVSGEGTFTDRDQALLLEMVPTRKDSPEARALKVENIDNIIRAKLGMTNEQNPAGAKTINFSDLPP